MLPARARRRARSSAAWRLLAPSSATLRIPAQYPRRARGTSSRNASIMPPVMRPLVFLGARVFTTCILLPPLSSAVSSCSRFVLLGWYRCLRCALRRTALGFRAGRAGGWCGGHSTAPQRGRGDGGRCWGAAGVRTKRGRGALRSGACAARRSRCPAPRGILRWCGALRKSPFL